MKVSVMWRAETPKAVEIAGAVSEKLSYAVRPGVDGSKRQHIELECTSLSSDRPYREDPPLHGIYLLNQIVQFLWDNYQVQGERLVDGCDIGGYACHLTRKVKHFEKATDAAIAELRETRSWLRDKRIARVRQALEVARSAKVE